MTEAKKIEISRQLHRLTARIPELQQEYGLWIITGNSDIRSRLLPPDDQVRERRFEFFSLSHMFDGGGKLYLNGTRRDIAPGDAVLICPGDWHLYGGREDFYCEDNICFCGRIPEALRKAGILRTRLFHLGKTRRLRPILENSRHPSPAVQLQAALELQTLLLEFGADAAPLHTPFESLLNSIREAPANHWWSVRELAELRGISLDCLRREFISNTGMLPKKYIEEFKLQQAAKMLIAENLSVTATAHHFGYIDPYHFSRRFKLKFGVSPAHYRKIYS